MVMYLEMNHGTDKNTSVDLANGRVNVAVGGGEIGKGFYAGSHHWEAMAWAYHTCKKDKTPVVVKFKATEHDFFNFDIRTLDFEETITHRLMIKNQGGTRSHLFNVDIVWAPIVGSLRVTGDQFKYESQNSQSYINSNQVTKTVHE